MLKTNNIPGLLPEEMEHLLRIFKRVAIVKSVVLYGSRAKGTHRAGSEIDLTLKGNRITTRQLLEISSEIDDLLMPYQVDLSIFDHIDNQALIDHINRVGQTIFSRRKPCKTSAGNRDSRTTKALCAN